MSTLPPIFVINREKDRARKKDAIKSYSEAKLAPIFVEAIDGHDNIKTMSPYVDLLADSFWGQPDIKPGAFACYLSHRKTWQLICDGDDELAIVTEDDSYPVANFHKRFDKLQFQINDCELTFINNRLCAWTNGKSKSANDAIWDRLKKSDPNDDHFRAPGADAYVISKDCAQKLLDLTQQEGFICGVDWLMLALAWDSSEAKHSEVKSVNELKKIWKVRGPQPAHIDAMILSEPLFEINSKLASSINHSNRIEIVEFREKLA